MPSMIYELKTFVNRFSSSDPIRGLQGLVSKLKKVFRSARRTTPCGPSLIPVPGHSLRVLPDFAFGLELRLNVGASFKSGSPLLRSKPLSFLVHSRARYCLVLTCI